MDRTDSAINTAEMGFCRKKSQSPLESIRARRILLSTVCPRMRPSRAGGTGISNSPKRKPITPRASATRTSKILFPMA